MKQLPIVLGAVWVFLALMVGIVIVTWPQPQAAVGDSEENFSVGSYPAKKTDPVETVKARVSIANTPGSEGEDFTYSKVQVSPR